MSLTFSIIRHRHKATSTHTITPAHSVFLVEGDWDDYSFKTSFQVLYPLKDGKRLDLGTIKLGYAGQEPGWTGDSMDSEFTALKPGWFSLGQDVEYYESIRKELSEEDANTLLSALRDIVHAEVNLNSLRNVPEITSRYAALLGRML